MIQKPNKNPTFPQNYKPIRFFPMIKIKKKKIINKTERRYMRTKHQLDEQFEFREEQSTELHVLRLAGDITRGFNRNQSTGNIFLNVAKAFDTVLQAG